MEILTGWAETRLRGEGERAAADGGGPAPDLTGAASEVIDKLILGGRPSAALPVLSRRFHDFLALLGYNLNILAVLTPAMLSPVREFLERCLKAREAGWFQPQMLARVQGPYQDLAPAAPLLRQLDLVAFALSADFHHWAAWQAPESVLLFYREYRKADEMTQDRLLRLALASHPRALALVRLADPAQEHLPGPDRFPADLLGRLLLLRPGEALYWNGRSFVPDLSLGPDGQGTVVAAIDGEVLRCRRRSRTWTWPARDGDWLFHLRQFLGAEP